MRARLFFIFLLMAVVWSFTGVVYAQELPANLPKGPIFSLYPAKIEVGLKPNQKVIKSIKVINTLGYDAVFSLSVEDIGPSKNIREPATLYGDVDGPFTVRNLVTLPYKTITIKNGETKTVPIEIAGADKLDLAGRYGVVLFSVTSESAGAGGQSTRIVSRLGTTLLVKTATKADEVGEVLSFGVIGNAIRFYNKTEPLMAQVTFKNNGNVHLNTYGVVAAKNIFGQEVAVQELDPWYILPGAIRLREISFGNKLHLGPYHLVAQVNRGYNDQIDQLSAWVIILPTPFISILIVALLIGSIMWWLAKKRRTRNYV